MTEHEFDRRITAALRDAASTTPRDQRALDQIVRRAGEASAGGPRRSLLVGLAAASLVAVGAVGVWLVRPNPNSAPAATSSSDGRTVERLIASPTLPNLDDLTRPGTVDSPLFFDDATLLAQLYTGFNVGSFDDASRTYGGSMDVEVDDEGMAACLGAQGFEYFPDQPGAANAWWLTTKQLMDPADFAAQYGFGISAQALGLLSDGPAAANPAFADYYVPLSPEQKDAYDTAEEACRQEHSNWSDVATPDSAWVNAKDYAWAQFETVARGDTRVADALGRWRACMSAVGFIVDDPGTVSQPFYTRTFEYEPWSWPLAPGTPAFSAVEPILAEEIAMATAHVECIAPYNAALRAAIFDHFEEYKSILASAIASGVQSDANG